MAGPSTIKLKDGTELHTTTINPGEDTDVFISNNGIFHVNARKTQGVAKQAREEKDALLEAWQQLVTIVTKYKPIIDKRWKKKSREKQRDLLKDIWPNIPTPHRPDFHYWKERGDVRKLKISGIRSIDDAVMYPDMNLEDLTRPHFLLQLLASRVAAPAIFANRDFAAMKVGLQLGKIQPKEVNGFTMYLGTATTLQSYGRIADWKDSVEASDDYHAGIGMLPGQGLLVLKRQRWILQVLVKCCTALLHDLPIQEDLVAQEPAIWNLDIGTDFETPHYESLAAMSIESPYRIPDKTNFGPVYTFVEAMKAEVEDDLTALKENPEYFSQTAQENLRMQSDSVQQQMRGETEWRTSDRLWDRAISNMIAAYYHNVFHWNAISQDLEALMEHRGRPDFQTSPAAQRLRSRLLLLTGMTMKAHIRWLGFYLPSTPAFSPKIRRYTDASGQHHGELTDDPGDYLYWLMCQLTTLPREATYFLGKAELIQEINVVLSESRSERGRLSSALIGLMSDVSILAELERQIMLSTSNHNMASSATQQELEAELKSELNSFWLMREVFFPEGRLRGDLNLGMLATSLRSVDYPSHKVPTANTVEKMRTAENHLDDFWSNFEDALVSKLGKTSLQLVGDRVKEQQILRTPPWVEPQLGDRDPGTSKIEGLSLHSAFSNDVEYTGQKAKDLLESQPRAKVKTRGEPSRQERAPEGADLQEDGPSLNHGESLLEKIPVGNKHFKAFSSLFRSPAAEGSASGELPWKNFVHAMTHIGFTAQHLDGSAWVFEKVPGAGRILIHEPHPESKISPHIARRIARRLQRNFGWLGKTFVAARGNEDTAEDS